MTSPLAVFVDALLAQAVKDRAPAQLLAYIARTGQNGDRNG